MDTPYSQSGQDPTQQQGLLQILQQIQAIQNRPLIPDNPLSQLGAALQGASAGFAGQPNPAIAQAMAQRQQQLSGLSQTAGVVGRLGDMAFKARDYRLRVDMEQRRIKAEEEKNRRDESHQRLAALAPMAKEWAASLNPETRRAGIDAQRALLKSVKIDLPDAVWEGMKIAPPFNPKDLSLLQHAIEAKQPDEVLLQMFPGLTQPTIDFTRAALQTDAGRQAAGFKTPAELMKDDAGAREARATADSAVLTTQTEGRTAHLNALPLRTQAQETELLGLRDLKGAPDLTRSVALALMRSEGLPVDLAAAKAKKIMAEATRVPQQEKDFEKAKQELMRNNPGMTEGAAFLQLTAQLNAVKKTDDKFLNSLDRGLDVMKQIAGYSAKVNTAKTGLGLVIQGTKNIYGTMMRDEDIVGLKRQQAYLVAVAQELQRDTRFSDADAARMETIIPGIFATGPNARAAINEMISLLHQKKAQEMERQRAAKSLGPLGPQTPTTPIDPADPFGWNKRKGGGLR